MKSLAYRMDAQMNRMKVTLHCLYLKLHTHTVARMVGIDKRFLSKSGPSVTQGKERKYLLWLKTKLRSLHTTGSVKKSQINFPFNGNCSKSSEEPLDCTHKCTQQSTQKLKHILSEKSTLSPFNTNPESQRSKFYHRK